MGDNESQKGSGRVLQAIKSLYMTLQNRLRSAAEGEYKMLMRTCLPIRRADISVALDAVAAADDQLSEAQVELEALAPLVEEARAARRWTEEAVRRRALSEGLDDMVGAHDELQVYIRFRQEQAEFIEDGQRLIRRAAGATRKAMQSVADILERIAGSRFEEERRIIWQELDAIWDTLRPIHQELRGFHAEFDSRFANAGLQRWANLYWRTLLAGFPHLHAVEADLSATNPDQQASILKRYRHLVGWGLFMPPA